jgi:beta-galactosidase
MAAIYSMNLNHQPSAPLAGHLRMGGANPKGEWIGANSQSLTRAGQPWTPVMGEIHFSRLPRAAWRDALLKMKAGGIQIAATYIFWNYHEETEGVFDWSDNRDLRAFITLCGETGLLAYPRIGPWAHGEARLGGFPDWLMVRCGSETRRDAPLYFGYAKTLYQQIAAQLSGLLWKDGGPIVGIQIENELTDQPAHLATLKALAREVGLDVPIYTMTGWGPAQVPEDELIPVFGGYPDAPWDRQHETWARDSRKHYFFSPLRDDNTIGADLGRKSSVPDQTYLQRYPFGTCELGGGVQVTYHRRPWITPQDAAVIPFCKVGAGANMLGYYMYHGGTHPSGLYSSLQESQETGYPNDLPVRSYDFQAPLGEFGQVREHFHSLRALHLFMQDFGPALAPLPPIFPAQTPSNIDDRATLRWVVRSDGQTGFLFANTYQRIEVLEPHADVQFELHLRDTTSLTIPSQPVTIQAGEQVLWPFNLQIGGLLLSYASANLICRLDEPGRTSLVFSANQGIAPEVAFPTGQVAAYTGSTCEQCEVGALTLFYGLIPGLDCWLEVTSPSGAVLRLIILAPGQAGLLSKCDLFGVQRLILSPALLLPEAEHLHIRSTEPENLWFASYPPLDTALTADLPLQVEPAKSTAIFSYYRAQVTPRAIPISARKISEAGPARTVTLGPAGVAQAPTDKDFELAETWQVDLPVDAMDGSPQVYLKIHYAADAARAYLDGQLIADDFCYGRAWEIGLRQFAPRVLQAGLRLQFLPCQPNAPIYLPFEYAPGDSQVHVTSISAVPEYEVQLKLP